MKNPHVSALAAAHGAAVLFGLTGILGALIRFDAVAITAGRAGFAATALLVLALTQRRPLLQGLGPRRAGIVLASGFLLAVHWITFFMAVKVGGVAVATLGFASFPAFIALLDVVLFRERIGPAEGTMLALVTLGLVLVTPSFDVGDQGTVGLLWGLASGLSFAGLAHTLFVKSLEALDARSAGMIIALEPVYAIACAWWLFGEEPSGRMLVGASLIILATVLLAMGHTPSAARKGPPKA